MCAGINTTPPFLYLHSIGLPFTTPFSSYAICSLRHFLFHRFLLRHFLFHHFSLRRSLFHRFARRHPSFYKKNKIILTTYRYIKSVWGSSSIGRAEVSKTSVCGFKSRLLHQEFSYNRNNICTQTC